MDVDKYNLTTILLIVKFTSIFLTPFILHKILPKIFFRDRRKLFNVFMEFVLQTISYTLIPIILLKFSFLSNIFRIEPAIKYKNILLIIFLYIISIPFLLLGLKFQKLREEYPLWRAFKSSSPKMKILYIILYLIYYINWEFYFRGIFIVILPSTEYNFFKMKIANDFLIINSIQSLLAGLYHYDKPLPEFILSFPVNFIFGCMAYKFGSIIPCIIVHYLIGVTFDIFVSYIKPKNAL